MTAATIRDVARAAGLSPAAVSRYLNGRLELPDATRRRVDGAVRRLGYRPHALARRLSSGASETLGLITTDVAYPFFAAIASAAEEEAARHGYGLAVFNSRNALASELQLLDRIAERQVDGILLLTNRPGTAALVQRIDELGRVVLVDEDVRGARAPRLFADNVAGGRLAADALLERGHRRVAFVGGPRGMVSADGRFRGFRERLRDAGVALPAELVWRGAYGEAAGAAALARLCALREGPTAIFAAADQLALGVLRAARERGLRIPRDCSLVGFDDLPFADLLDPPLTTIRQDPAAFGRRGVRLLLALLAGDAVAETRELLPVELVDRASVVSL